MGPTSRLNSSRRITLSVRQARPRQTLDPFYQPPLQRLSQGDIFLDVPHLYLRDDEVTFLRRRSLKGGHPGADLYVLGDKKRSPSNAFNPEGDELAAPVQLAPGMLLTHACEIDNRPTACVSVALIRALRTVPQENQEPIVAGENLAFLPLPENDDPPLEESYVDFSRVTSLRQDVLLSTQRILSPAPALLKALYVGMARYLTRYDIAPSLLEKLVEEAIAEATKPLE